MKPAMTSRFPVPTLETRTRAWLVFDLGYLVIMFVTATARDSGFDPPGVGLATISIAAWLPLLVRRRWPLIALIGTTSTEAVHIILTSVAPHPLATTAMGAYQPVPLATIAAAFTLAAVRPRRRGWRPAVISAAVLLVCGVISQSRSLLATDFVVFDLVIIATGAGILVSLRTERQARDERDHVTQIRREVLAERLRIARDLHDVLAHHLTLVNAQAGVADYLLRTNPSAAASALQDIATNTRLALDGLRDTVGLLRDDTDQNDGGPDQDGGLRPAPGLNQLSVLIDQFRAAGATIHQAGSGSPRPLSRTADLAAYRILQEALTNATKHAPGAEVLIELTWRPGALELRIDNGPAPGRPGHRGPGTRHGLIGMRERAGTCGGNLTAEPTEDGGFSVRAILPGEDQQPA